MKNVRNGLVVGLIVCCVLAGCSNELENDNKQILQRGLAGDADTLDPHKTASVQGHRILVDIYEGLLRYDAFGKLEGGVADSYSVSKDGLTYTFKLRANAKWSNGDRVTAGDFEYAFERLVDPNTAAFYATFLRVIENAHEILAGDAKAATLGVTAVSDNELVIKLQEPAVYFPQLLTHPATSPLHEASIEKLGEKWARPGSMVSNGAYNLTGGGLLSAHYDLAKNEHYHEAEKVTIDNVRWHVIVDDSAMYNRYRAGEIHITGTVPSVAFDVIREERPNELKVAPRLGVYYYGLNLTKPPFGDNAKLRKALSMVIDRDLLVEAVKRRGELPAYGFVPPGIEGYEPARFEYAEKPIEERIAEAKKLYEEAGFNESKPAKFELRYNVKDGDQRMAAAVEAMWREALGADVELHNEEQKVLISNIKQMTITEAFRLSWIGDYFDPLTFLELGQTGNQQNLTGWSNERYDELMEMASREQDVEERMSMFREAERIFINDHAIIPLYFYVSKRLVSEKVKGWNDTLVDFHPSQYLSLDATD